MRLTIVIVAALTAGQALAQNVEDRLALVGVITGSKSGKQTDTAILKDLSTKKSIVVRKGGSIQEFPGYKVVSIDAKKVILSGNGHQVALTHEGFPTDAKAYDGGNGGYDTSFSDGATNDFVPSSDMPPPPPPPPPEPISTSPYSNPYSNTYNGNGMPVPPPPIEDVNRYNPPPPVEEQLPMYTETFDADGNQVYSGY